MEARVSDMGHVDPLKKDTLRHTHTYKIKNIKIIEIKYRYKDVAFLNI